MANENKKPTKKAPLVTLIICILAVLSGKPISEVISDVSSAQTQEPVTVEQTVEYDYEESVEESVEAEINDVEFVEEQAASEEVSEETVVEEAESYDDIQVCACPVQETGLEDGVAHCGTYLLAFGRDAHGGLCTAFDLADYGIWLEAVGPQDTGEDTGFVDETYAVGYTNLAGADLTGKFHDFLYTGPLAVAFKFNFRTCYHDLTVPVLIITLQGPL